MTAGGDGDGDFCPDCARPAAARCRCPLWDSVCPAGHAWHRCALHGRVVAGPADHRAPAGACRCPPAGHPLLGGD